jgi:hypothetical protein
MKSTHFRYGLAAFLVIAASAAFAGYPIVPVDVMAGIGMLGMIGNVEIVEIKKLIEDQGKAWDDFKKTNDALIKAKADGKAVGDLEAKLAKMGDAPLTTTQGVPADGVFEDLRYPALLARFRAEAFTGSLVMMAANLYLRRPELVLSGE